MFASVRDFVFRHRRKFIFTGLAIGGLSLLGKYAEKRLVEWGENSAKKIIDQQKRRTHYDRSLNTTRVMLLEFLPGLRRVIEKDLDSEYFVRAIKEQPEKKRELWDQLKYVGFGRTIGSIICVAFTAPLAHIMMMILAANTLDSEAEGSKMASQLVQARYISCLQNLVEQQMPKLLKRIMLIVNKNLSGMLLTEKLTVSDLESVLQKITLDITSDGRPGISDALHCSIEDSFSVNTDSSSLKSDDSNEHVGTVLPWTQYLLPPEPIQDVPSDHKTLSDMYTVTTDIVNTDDFNDVVNIIIQLGLNFVLDEMVDNTVFTQSSIIAHNDHNIIQTMGKVPDNSSILGSADSKISSGSSTKLTDISTECNFPAKVHNHASFASDFNSVSCVVAKLVPVLSALLHKVLPDSGDVTLSSQSSSFYTRLVNCTQLEALSFNVYNALIFSNAGEQS